jgi:anaerobic selenocysteine-containing dehydrogenase
MPLLLNISKLSMKKNSLKICGVPLTLMQETARVLAGKNKIIACWAMGLTQHKNAVDTIKEVVNLLLIERQYR